MGSASIIIRGIENASAYLRKERAKILKETNIGVGKATLFIEREVKLSISGQRAEPTSVDTGRFMGSVTSRVSNGIGTVSTNVSYAKHLEYGTSRIFPRPHFRNSLARNRKQVRKIIQDQINKRR